MVNFKSVRNQSKSEIFWNWIPSMKADYSIHLRKNLPFYFLPNYVWLETAIDWFIKMTLSKNDTECSVDLQYNMHLVSCKLIFAPIFKPLVAWVNILNVVWHRFSLNWSNLRSQKKLHSILYIYKIIF